LEGSLLAALTVYGRLAGKTNFEFVEYEKCSWSEAIAKEKYQLLSAAASKALLE